MHRRIYSCNFYFQPPLSPSTPSTHLAIKYSWNLFPVNGLSRNLFTAWCTMSRLQSPFTKSTPASNSMEAASKGIRILSPRSFCLSTILQNSTKFPSETNFPNSPFSNYPSPSFFILPVYDPTLLPTACMQLSSQGFPHIPSASGIGIFALSSP